LISSNQFELQNLEQNQEICLSKHLINTTFLLSFEFMCCIKHTFLQCFQHLCRFGLSANCTPRRVALLHVGRRSTCFCTPREKTGSAEKFRPEAPFRRLRPHNAGAVTGDYAARLRAEVLRALGRAAGLRRGAECLLLFAVRARFARVGLLRAVLAISCSLSQLARVAVLPKTNRHY
jgi:hypothetical protein